ncbi:MAG TPA: hypothetical protein VIH18_28385 [Candidatus Binatia bacterium]|jgi:hypothetical protein
MTEIRRADPVARRQAVLFVVFGALAGALLVVGFERYRNPLRDWFLSEPEKSANRVKLVFFVSGVFLSAPLVAFAVYLWSLGAKVLRANQFPPPGYRVIRDTPVVGGQAAMSRGRGLKILALCLGVASAMLWLLLWRLVSIVREVKLT